MNATEEQIGIEYFAWFYDANPTAVEDTDDEFDETDVARQLAELNGVSPPSDTEVAEAAAAAESEAGDPSKWTEA